MFSGLDNERAGMRLLPVTVVIPVLNEELNLPACLASLDHAFEKVVVVDSGSSDRTCDIAVACGADLLQFQWDGKFPKKRNWVLRNYNFETPWVLFLDADERVTTGFVEELFGVLPGTVHAGFWITFTNWFMGTPLHYGDPFRKLSLFRVGAGEFEKFPENDWTCLDMEIHEHPVLDGSVGTVRARLQHNDFRSLEHYLAKHDEYAAWEARRFHWLRGSDRQQWRNLTPRQRMKYRMIDKPGFGFLYFIVSYVLKLGVLDGRAGFCLAKCKWKYFRKIRMAIKKPECI